MDGYLRKVSIHHKNSFVERLKRLFKWCESERGSSPWSSKVSFRTTVSKPKNYFLQDERIYSAQLHSIMERYQDTTISVIVIAVSGKRILHSDSRSLKAS